MNKNILSDKGFLVVLALAILAFCLQINNLCSYVPIDEDDSHYLYAAQLMSRGAIPYRDFVLVHPPLLFVLGALFFRIGFPVVSVQVIFLVLNLFILFVVYELGKVLLRSSWGAVGAVGLLLCSGVLFSYDFHTMALRPMATILVLSGVLLWFKSFPEWAGVLFALSCLTVFLSAIPVIIFLLIFLIANWRKWIRMLAGFLSLAIPSFAALSFVPHFWELTVGFQVGALSTKISRSLIASQYFSVEWFLFATFLFGVILLVFKREKELFLFAACGVFMFSSFFLLGGRMKLQNFTLVAPIMAVVGAYPLTIIRKKKAFAIAIVFLLGVGIFRQFQTSDPMQIFQTHALYAPWQTAVLLEAPSPILTGRSPMIALQAGAELPRWYYGSDFYYFLHSGRYKDPRCWDELLRNTNSILWMQSLWDMMPPETQATIVRDFVGCRVFKVTILIRKSVMRGHFNAQR